MLSFSNFINLLAWSKEYSDTQKNIVCGFTLKRERDMIRTYKQIKAWSNAPYRYMRIIWAVWLNS